jgi:hypothetical protein
MAGMAIRARMDRAITRANRVFCGMENLLFDNRAVRALDGYAHAQGDGDKF